MNDPKTAVFFVLAFVAMAAIWWFGWFGPVTKVFQEIRSNTVSTEDPDDDNRSQGWGDRNIFRSPDND
jgi:hypothetical protein